MMVVFQYTKKGKIPTHTLKSSSRGLGVCLDLLARLNRLYSPNRVRSDRAKIEAAKIEQDERQSLMVRDREGRMTWQNIP